MGLNGRYSGYLRRLLDLYAGKLYRGQPQHADGSIGIFGVINTVENSLSSIGVHSDGVSTSPLADIFDDQSAVTGSAADDATQY